MEQPRNPFSKLAEGVKRILPKKRQSPPELAPEIKAKILEDFILKGVGMIKDGDFDGAGKYFENSEQTDLIRERTGIDFEPGLSLFLRGVPQTETEVKEIIQTLREKLDFQYESASVRVPSVVWPEAMPSDPRTLKIKDYIDHFVSLGALEEWLHGLQYLRGHLTKFQDSEMDIAAWMIERDVPFTDEFFPAYSERERVIEDPDYKERVKITSKMEDLGLAA